MKKSTLSAIILSLNLLFSSQILARVNEAKQLLESEKNTISVFQNNVNSVVNVSNIKISRRGGWWFDMSANKIPQGAGSGFVWDNKGHIVTNYHVIEGGDLFQVSFHKDKEQYEAVVVGAVPEKDIAVLKLKKLPKKLRPIQVGKSSNLVVGQKAMAIGNPFSLDHTITSGIISALNRKIDGVGGVKIHGMIQTDSSINPGNSGGPLLDSSGNLIGVNTVIYSASGSSSGIGFAVPVDTVSRIVPQLIKHGKIIRPALGVVPLNEYEMFRLGIEEKGVGIKLVLENGAAEKAGLKGIEEDRRGRIYLGDNIVGIDNHEIKNFDDLYNTLDKYKIGQTATIKVLRNGKLKKFKLTFQELKQRRKLRYRR